MEAEGIPQAYIISDFSCDNAVVKPQGLPTKCTPDDAPAPSMDAFFDCNICLDFVVDPVVTFCGHLYCWPCIYRWMQLKGVSHQQCPVCKAFISQNTLVPLYGRGGHSTKVDPDVPHRPTLHLHRHFPGTDEDTRSNLHQPMQQPHFRRRHHHHPPYASLSSSYMSGLSSPLLASLFSSSTGGVLDLNPYHLTLSGNNPRLRRQQMQIESSLHQIWLFLFCCAVLCLLLF